MKKNKVADHLMRHIIGMLVALLVVTMSGLIVHGCGLGGRDSMAAQVCGKDVLMAPLPDVCAVCGNGDGTEYHAPVLINLSTGEVGELRVYETAQLGKKPSIAQIQNVGTFYFSKCAGLTGRVETYSHTHMIEIPPKSNGVMMENYCRDCRTVLAPATSCGYALLDLYDIEHVQAYPLEEGTCYKIREYDVSMFRDQNDGELTLKVEGTMEGLIFVD